MSLPSCIGAISTCRYLLGIRVLDTTPLGFDPALGCQLHFRFIGNPTLGAPFSFCGPEPVRRSLVGAFPLSVTPKQRRQCISHSTASFFGAFMMGGGMIAGPGSKNQASVTAGINAIAMATRRFQGGLQLHSPSGQRQMDRSAGGCGAELSPSISTSMGFCATARPPAQLLRPKQAPHIVFLQTRPAPAISPHGSFGRPRSGFSTIGRPLCAAAPKNKGPPRIALPAL